MRRKFKQEREFRYPNQKVSADERADLINLWLAGDLAGVFAMQKRLGVDAKYTARRAHVLGLTRERPSRHHSDPRWEWAIARGKVIV